MATFLGNPVTFTGSQLQVRGYGPWFSLITPALEKKSLADFAGKKKSSALSHPSTQVSVRCKHVTSIKPYRIWKTLSSWRSLSTFLLLKVNGALLKGSTMPSCSQTTTTIPSGKAYGLLINEWHLLARAVLVLDADNKVTYVEYLDNINSEPNYDAAIRSRQCAWINEKRSATSFPLL